MWYGALVNLIFCIQAKVEYLAFIVYTKPGAYFYSILSQSTQLFIVYSKSEYPAFMVYSKLEYPAFVFCN